MKSYLLGFIISAVAFALATFIIPGLNYHNNPEVLFKAAAVFAVLNIFLRPVIKILLLPLNFLTFGLLSGVTGLVVLLLVTLIIPGFNLSETFFPGVFFFGVNLPSFSLNVLFTAIFGAFVISSLASLLYWITK